MIPTLTVPQNSYVTLAEADDYIAFAYKDSEIATAWAAQSEEQRQAALIAACFDLESLPFPGRKRRADQALMFPRYPSYEVPLPIKQAQIEIALLPLKPEQEALVADAEQRRQLQSQGVTAFSIGKLSETFGGSNMATEHRFLLDDKVQRLLSVYLRGSYTTC